jgi:hypothetical protein
MVKDINELKNLILWAKEQKIKSMKIADVHFELSDLALVQDMVSIEDAILNENKSTVVQKDLIDSEAPEASDDEDLYWSTRS